MTGTRLLTLNSRTYSWVKITIMCFADVSHDRNSALSKLTASSLTPMWKC